jgi:spectinomycin phosphotransferase
MEIDHDQIAACLRASYGVSVSTIEALALGLDAEAAVFRVAAADGHAYFLKLRHGAPVEPSILVPRFLREAGIEQVVAPLPTRAPPAWGIVGDLSALLYPYVPGRSGLDGGLTAAQWVELGATLGQIHAIEIPTELAARLPREQFVPNPRWIDPLRAVLAGRHRNSDQDDIARETDDFLAARRDEIVVLLERTEALGARLRRRPHQRVLCHSDIHLGNVQVDTRGRVHVVDWDQPILAPRECDLMLLFGSAIGGFAEGSSEETAFLVGYGEVAPDPLTMAYYYHERVTTDIGAFAYEIYWLPGASDEARRGAARWLERLFEPGRSVDAAHRAAVRLSA